MENQQKLKTTLGLFVLSIYTMFAFQNCAQTKFAGVANNLSSFGTVAGTRDMVYDFSVSTQANAKMDILFVIDNSISMQAEQLRLAETFATFISNLSGLDYRVGITTTDNTGDYVTPATLGKLLPMKLKSSTAAAPYFIDRTTPNGNALFIDSIQTGTQGSGTETGMTSIGNFVAQSLVPGSNEKQFIRPEAIFSTIVISDSDQAQYPANTMAVNTLIDYIKLAYSNSKRYVHHSSIALPNDVACLAQSEVYGKSYFDLAVATGGVNASICSLNYASQFKLIADVLINKVSGQSLECPPIDADQDGNLDIAIRSSSGAEIKDFTVRGNVVSFTHALSAVDNYRIKYKCATQ